MNTLIFESCDRADRNYRTTQKSGEAVRLILYAAILLAVIFAPKMGAEDIAHPFFNGKSEGNKYYKDAKRGWFYYEKTPEPLKEEEIEEKKIVNTYPIVSKTPEQIAAMHEAESRFIRSIPYNNLNVLSAEEFRQTFDKVRDIATMRPNLENSLAYMRLNHYSTTKATHFSTVMEVVSTNNEFIDPTIARSGYSNKLIREQNREKTKQFFEENMNRLAITVFYGGVEHKSYSHQKGAIETLEKEYPNAEVMWVDVSSSPETVQKMGLLTLPETWLAWQNDDKKLIWRRLISGVATYDEIVEKTLFMHENTIAKDIFSEK